VTYDRLARSRHWASSEAIRKRLGGWEAAKARATEGHPELREEAVGTEAPLDTTEDIPRRLLKLLQQDGGASLVDLANGADMSPRRVEQAIELLRNRERVVVQQGDRYHLLGIDSNPDDATIDLEYEGDSLALGVVSDTHLGSMYQQVTMLGKAYEWFAENDVRHVVHCGDVLEGDGSVYSGQRFEMWLFGVDRQIEYVLEAYPRVPDITTHIVSGNHDESFVKSAGFNAVKDSCSRRDDLHYLGRYGAYLQISQAARVYAWHGQGIGKAYADSYPIQKTIEAFSPENKPQILLMGHLHSDCRTRKRNVSGWLVPCFQSQTPHAVAKRWEFVQGAMILEIRFAPSGNIREMAERTLPQYSTVAEDYPHR